MKMIHPLYYILLSLGSTTTSFANRFDDLVGAPLRGGHVAHFDANARHNRVALYETSSQSSPGTGGVHTSLRQLDNPTLSPEVFPLVLALFLSVASVGFSILLVVHMISVRGRSQRTEKEANNHGSSASEEEDSWVVEDPGNHQTTQESSHDTIPAAIQTVPRTIDDSVSCDDDNINPKSLSDHCCDDSLTAEPLLSWRGLTCSYLSKKGRINSNNKKGTKKSTLCDASGEMRRGELVAIMGPSGSGKTTLLDILSGRKSTGRIEGEISVLGQHVRGDLKAGAQRVLKNVAAYIPQVVEFFPTQTPEEAVAFASNLKLGRDPRGDHMRRAYVDSLLSQIGLAGEIQTRSIGGTLPGGFVIRGLSGGERQRLALACALAMKPSLLFIDELTSGLDSDNAVIVIDLLKKMCTSLGVAAAVVIHQPDIDVFDCFDRLILLSEGRCIFSDKCLQIPFFYQQVLREAMPDHYRLPADLIKRAAAFDFATASTWNESSSLLVPTSELKSRRTGSNPSIFYKFRTVFERNLVNHYVRNLTNLAARLVIYAGCAFVPGLVFWQVGMPKDGETLSPTETSVVVGAFLFLSQSLYLLPFAQISTFFFDKRVFTRESALGLYPPWIYSVSQLILESWLLVLAAILQACIAVPMIGLWNPTMSKFASFSTALAVFCVTATLGNAIVLLIAMVTFSQDLTFLTGSFLVDVALSTAGGFVPFPSLESFVAWLQWLSPIKYSIQAFSIQTFAGTDSMQIIEARELDRPDSVSSNLGALLCFFTVLALGTMVSLTMQREVK